MTSTPPTHPQPGFYEQVASDLGFNPEALPPRNHEQFMEDRNHVGWLGYTLSKFDLDKKKTEQAEQRGSTAFDPRPGNVYNYPDDGMRP